MVTSVSDEQGLFTKLLLHAVTLLLLLILILKLYSVVAELVNFRTYVEERLNDITETVTSLMPERAATVPTTLSAWNDRCISLAPSEALQDLHTQSGTMSEQGRHVTTPTDESDSSIHDTSITLAATVKNPPQMKSSTCAETSFLDTYTSLKPGDIDVPCVCQESLFPPFICNGHVHFLYWETKAPQRTNHSHSSVQEYIVSYNLADCKKLPRKNITGIKRCVCFLFPYNQKLTLFGGEYHAGNYKVGLYQLPDHAAQSYPWKLVLNSKLTIHNLDPNNCICVQYKDKVVVATVSAKLKSSPQIFFHTYSPSDENDVYWKSAFLSLPNFPKQVPQDNRTCQIQSCVVLLENAYFAISIDHVVYIYQADLTILFDSFNNHLALPAPIRCENDLSAVKCFLSLINKDIVVVSAKVVDSKTLIEFKPLRHSSSQLHQCTYQFSSIVKVITATVLPGAKKSVVVYHDSQTNSCKLSIVDVDCR